MTPAPGLLARDIEDYPQARAAVEGLADQYDSIQVATCAQGWVLTCRDGGRVVAVFTVDSEGHVRGQG